MSGPSKDDSSERWSKVVGGSIADTARRLRGGATKRLWLGDPSEPIAGHAGVPPLSVGHSIAEKIGLRSLLLARDGTPRPCKLGLVKLVDVDSLIRSNLCSDGEDGGEDEASA